MNNKTLLKILYVVLIFLLGFISAQLYEEYKGGGVSGFAVKAPSDFIDNEDILVYPDKIVIKIDSASLSNYDFTGSMTPVLREGVSGIVIKPKSAEEINLGDIVSFRKEGNLIVHRVVEKGEDGEGVYFITRGDNNLEVDEGKVRFSEIEHVLVGVIY